MAAGQVPAAQPTELSTVVVSATRSELNSVPTPANISVITAQDIERSGARNVTELLRGRAGIQVSDLFGDGSSGAVFDMRGFGATAGSNTLILIDGRRLNNAADIATPDVTTIALKNIERIEIIEGSAGTLFGNQAVGGVINIITKRPQEFQADMDVSIGSYDSRAVTTSVSDRLDNGISYRFAAEARESDNYRDNNSLEYQNAVGRVDYEHTGGRVFAEIHYTHENQDTPAALFADEVREDRRQSAAVYANDFQDTDTTVGRIGLSQDLNSIWMLDVEFAYRDVDRDFATSFRSGPEPPADQTRDVYTLTPRLIGTLPMNGGEAIFTLGADLEKTDYHLRSSLGKQDVDQRIQAYYVQGVIPINPEWSVTAGGRWAKVSNEITDSYAFAGGEDLDDEITVGTIGLTYRPNSSWRLFARADQNFRFAKVDEHTSVFGSTAGLKNQTGVSYEFGGEWNSDNARVLLTGYRLDLNDEISYDPALFENVNLDSTRRKGLILEAWAKVHDDIDVGFYYSYVDAETDSGSFAGNRIPLVAEHSTSLMVDYRPMPMLNLHAELLYVGDQVLGGDFANEFPELDDYTVVNLSGAYRVDHWRFEAKVNNLFDQEYSETGSTGYDAGFALRDSYFPAPERNFWLKVGYDF